MEFNLHGARPERDPAVSERIKGWVVQALGLPEDATLTVMELRCAEDDCPDVETVIGILDSPGQSRKYKVFKPMAEVTRDDLLAALGQRSG